MQSARPEPDRVPGRPSDLHEFWSDPRSAFRSATTGGSAHEAPPGRRSGRCSSARSSSNHCRSSSERSSTRPSCMTFWNRRRSSSVRIDLVHECQLRPERIPPQRGLRRHTRLQCANRFSPASSEITTSTAAKSGCDHARTDPGSIGPSAQLRQLSSAQRSERRREIVGIGCEGHTIWFQVNGRLARGPPARCASG